MAHTFTTATAAIALQRACPHGRAMVYIDNVQLLAHSAASARAAIRAWREVCTEFNVQTTGMDDGGDEDDNIYESYDFVGARVDLRNKVIALSEKVKRKLGLAADELRNCGLAGENKIGAQSSWTLRRAMAVLGLLGWCAHVLRLPRAPYFAYFAALRAAVGNPLDVAITFPDAAIQAACRWAAHMRDARSACLDASALRVAEIFSDASNTGWGAVIFHPAQQTPSISAGRWMTPLNCGPPDHINVREIRAARFALAFAASVVDASRHRAALYVDSAVAAGAITKGRSSSATVNEEVKEFFDQLEFRHLTVGWVAGEENPADGPSRWLGGLGCS
ncbi:MAG: hypothetical protein EPO03_12005 [Porticoccaceae bacterium]|nr:MAG: hypothetical protein EPO03_12005 [Porticoccaceae bacterium]